jgi:hypothetical protein
MFAFSIHDLFRAQLVRLTIAEFIASKEWAMSYDKSRILFTYFL